MLKHTVFILGLFGSFFLNAFDYEEAEIVIETDENIIFDIEYSSTGKALIVADGKIIKWYSSDDYKLLSAYTNGHTKKIMTLSLSNDSSWLVSGGKDSTIILWDIHKSKIKEQLNYHDGIVTTVEISPDSRYILSGGTDNKVVLYDRVGQKIKNSLSFNDDVLSIAISPDQTTFSIASVDGTVSIYNFDSGIEIKKLLNDKWVRDISYSNDGQRIISCGDNSRVHIWSIKDLKNIYQIDNLRFTSNWLLSVKFHDDSKSFVVGGVNGSLRISTPFGVYTTQIGVAINDIEFVPNKTMPVKVALATHGKGVILCDSKNMRITKK